MTQTLSDLELDELEARLDDLVEKISRDIAEGGYRHGTALLALISVALRALRQIDCRDRDAAFHEFLSVLIGEYRRVFDETDEASS